MKEVMKIKRIDLEIPIPLYKTSGAVALDMAARVNIVIPAKSIEYIPLNVVIKIPDNCFGLLVARSGTHKQGLMAVNGVGIIDRDYCGEEDELKFAAYNFTDQDVQVERGMRVAQLLILKQVEIMLEEVDQMSSVSRGGFGTTGIR